MGKESSMICKGSKSSRKQSSGVSTDSRQAKMDAAASLLGHEGLSGRQKTGGVELKLEMRNAASDSGASVQPNCPSLEPGPFEWQASRSDGASVPSAQVPSW